MLDSRCLLHMLECVNNRMKETKEKEPVNSISISSKLSQRAVSSEMPVVMYTSISSSSHVDSS